MLWLRVLAAAGAPALLAVGIYRKVVAPLLLIFVALVVGVVARFAGKYGKDEHRDTEDRRHRVSTHRIQSKEGEKEGQEKTSATAAAWVWEARSREEHARGDRQRRSIGDRRGG